MNCYHCGDPCESASEVIYKTQHFCCFGCRTVFEILETNDLDTYYDLEHFPGLKTELNHKDQFAFLDVDEFKQRWIRFENDNLTKVSFHIPQIHCSACIWLLENLTRLHKGISSAFVNFSSRRVDISFNNQDISLREVVELLSAIGYQPNLHDKLETSANANINRSLYYKIGVAGFCFGNIMLLAFPEYLGIDASYEQFRAFFGYISLILTLPVFFYAGFGYLRNAWKGIQQRFINMDIPIALGMITLLIRSSYEIISATGAGYFDSLSGLVFFLLLGQWFQKKTYDTLSFERDYKSYFPIAVSKKVGNTYQPTTIDDLKVGDNIELRNNELIPADSILTSGEAYIDYSFVTGESAPVRKHIGDQIFAGGRQVGTKIGVELTKKVNNSYLTQLWNQDIFDKKSEQSNFHSISNRVSKYFTIVILVITLCTALFWWYTDKHLMWNALTAVLIVACPCALALSVPFTLGNTIRLMGSKGLYLKNTQVIESMAAISTVVLDKTGTITHRGMKHINFHGDPLNTLEQEAVKSVVSNSLHPLSVAIKNHLECSGSQTLKSFKEISGQGIESELDGFKIKLGSAEFLDLNKASKHKPASRVYVAINGQTKGYFQLEQSYRKGLKTLVDKLKESCSIHLISGDNAGQKAVLETQFGIKQLHFDQSPMDKLNYIKQLESEHEQVMMIGDGLNDAGALKQSKVGVAVSDNIHQFSPACDAILSANQFEHLPYFINFSKLSIRIIKFSFAISFLYNVVGLSFAVSGKLSPIVAAILMPLSSITVVLFSTLATAYVAKKQY